MKLHQVLGKPIPEVTTPQEVPEGDIPPASSVSPKPNPLFQEGTNSQDSGMPPVTSDMSNPPNSQMMAFTTVTSEVCKPNPVQESMNNTEMDIPPTSSDIAANPRIQEQGSNSQEMGSVTGRKRPKKKSTVSKDDLHHAAELRQEPVGERYVKALPPSEKLPRGGYECSLCRCTFNDERARKLHVRGRKHKMIFKVSR